MDRLLERLQKGRGPGFGVSELAEAIGCSRSYIHKLIEAGAIRTGRVGSDYRIPLQEARRLAREAGVIE